MAIKLESFDIGVHLGMAKTKVVGTRTKERAAASVFQLTWVGWISISILVSHMPQRRRERSMPVDMMVMPLWYPIMRL